MPWLKSYPHGVDTIVHFWNYQTICEFIDEGFRDKEDRSDDPAFMQMGTPLSY